MQDDQPCEWRDVPGYEGLYQVSDTGRVKGKGILKPKKKNSGYLFVTLSKDNVKRNFYIHHLVAKVFHGDRPDRCDINHINGVKTDNRAQNLEYLTRAQNMQHAKRLGLHNNQGTNHYKSKFTHEDVKLLRLSSALAGEDVDWEKEAQTRGVSLISLKEMLQDKTYKEVR